MIYDNLEQRMAQSYIDLLPPFVPDDGAHVGAREQEDFYNLMRRLYQLAFDEPMLFVTTLHEDDAYPTRYKTGYNKPKLILEMRKFLKVVDGLVQKMMLAGQGGDVKFTARELTVLSRLGIDDLGALPAAWKWIAQRGDFTAFRYCLFKKDYPYALDVYTRLLGDKSFTRLVDWMLDNGYRIYEVSNVIASDCKLPLTIANPRWSDEPPRGGNEYKIKHTGISVLHDFYVREPYDINLGLCIPNGMKPYLEAFNEMDEGLKRFVISRTKKCDACKYCVQTDKKGTRPLANFPVEFEGGSYRLCTYFPGYTYSWASIDDTLADELIRMLAFMDTLAPVK